MGLRRDPFDIEVVRGSGGTARGNALRPCRRDRFEQAGAVAESHQIRPLAQKPGQGSAQSGEQGFGDREVFGGGQWVGVT
ncbi:hypothetical protein [Streptomyces tendae]